ncbi:MAG: murein transglycosylase A, partial [Desulfobacteraceae bacterium]
EQALRVRVAPGRRAGYHMVSSNDRIMMDREGEKLLPRIKKSWLVLALAALFLALCWAALHHALFPTLDREARTPAEALRRVRFFFPEFNDDLDPASLEQAVNRNLKYLDRLGPDHVFYYGEDKVPCKRVIETQKAFLDILSLRPDPEELNRLIRENFSVYRATGRKGSRSVLFTGYFEPVYKGSLARAGDYQYPLYRKPGDLLRVDLSPFGPDLEGRQIRARMEEDKLLPYYTRREIDHFGVLKGRGLELAWLRDPLDAAFLHIQGSGRILLPHGEALSVGYAETNGRPYRSIGRYMIERGLIPREEMSMQAIRSYLDEHPEQQRQILNYNPSYIFFKVKENGPLGNINVQLTPERSVALDSELFPRGSLCLVSTKKPTVRDGEIESWRNFSRFMLNQDTGGAIRGAGRADIFWGRGDYAELAAGCMKHQGELYILLLKEGKTGKNQLL